VKDHRRGAAARIAALSLLILPWSVSAGPIAPVCSSLIGVREELRLTPRADSSVELLALALSPGVIADQEIYQRLLRDLTLIRRMEPRLKNVHYRPRDDGKTLVLRLSDNASTLYAQGKYRHWDCVNRHYRFESAQQIAPGVVQLRLRGVYDLEMLASVYARVPGVVGAEAQSLNSIDDGATILVSRENDVWHYIFRTSRAKAFYYFTTQSNQSPRQGGVWTGRAATAPVWLRKYWFGTH